MVRKHTRRAAKAAYAVSLGVAIVVGLIAAGAGTASPSAKPKVTIGTKNFTEQYVLGQLYKQALEGKGVKVVYKENIGSSEIIDTALTSGKINFYPEYTGVIVQDLAHQASPQTAGATYNAAVKFEESRGFTLLKATPFYDTDAFGVLTSTAKKYKLRTISDVKRVKKTLKYGGFPECKTRITCFVGLRKVYGLKNIAFVPLSGISVYTAMDQRKIAGGDVFSTDPQLAGSKYTILKDTKHLFGFQNVAPIVTGDLAKDVTIRDTVNAVSAKLTNKAMIAMNKAVAIDKQSPEDVAKAFLKANGLIK
jgi:osmoprotectant transport system substrate-binding protein